MLTHNPIMSFISLEAQICVAHDMHEDSLYCDDCKQTKADRFLLCNGWTKNDRWDAKFRYAGHTDNQFNTESLYSKSFHSTDIMLQELGHIATLFNGVIKPVPKRICV